eukprot:m.176914 g.176914  ORF g.176914 m.176914 type:complete len:51 (+) comp16566_c1_seq6:1374-1526(+)
MRMLSPGVMFLVYFTQLVCIAVEKKWYVLLQRAVYSEELDCVDLVLPDEN